MRMIEETFAVRGYELDADGLVPPHVWLRYMEHLRWLSAGRGPKALADQFRAGNTFVVVAQGLEVRHDAGLGVELEGTLWLGRVGRTSADMYHVFVADGETVAAGYVTAVYLADGKPTPLPDSLRAQVAAEPLMRGLAFPEPMRGPVPTPCFEHGMRVRPADLDLLRHANHSSYSIFYDAGRRAAADAGAYGDASAAAAGRLSGLTIEYRQQALVSEQLAVATWLDGGEPLTLGFELRRDGDVLSRARALVGTR